MILEIEYLTGRVIATAFNDRNRVEWPPHPSRLFSALVATHHAGDTDEDEREALAWLAEAGPPAIVATTASSRDIKTHFVPVNDASVLSHTPLENGLLKLSDLQVQLRHAGTDKARAKLQVKIDKAQLKLQEQGRKTAGGTYTSKSLTGMLPRDRKKQARTFPSATPTDPRVYWRWNGEPPAAVERGVEALASRLVRLGHSSSLVRARVVAALPSDEAFTTWKPVDGDGEPLRVPLTDQLQRLEALFERHQGVEPRVLPFQWVNYGREGRTAPRAALASSCFASRGWIVLQAVEGPLGARDTIRLLPQTRTAGLASAVRGALIRYAHEAGEQLPELVIGHDSQGRRSQLPHVAIVPLPYVGGKYGDGHIRGVALVPPAQLDDTGRQALLRALGTWEDTSRREHSELNADRDIPALRILLGRAGVLHLQRLTEWSNLKTLRPNSWCSTATTWCSVTPVALDRNPGDLRGTSPRSPAAHEKAQRVVSRACEAVGLPAPVSVDISFAPTLRAAAPAQKYPPFPREKRADKPRRVLVHARVEFAVPVRGPVIIGAGRYLGLGLFAPTKQGGHAR